MVQHFLVSIRLIWKFCFFLQQEGLSLLMSGRRPFFGDSDGTERTENSTFFNASTTSFHTKLMVPILPWVALISETSLNAHHSLWHVMLNCVQFEHLFKFCEVSLTLTLGLKWLIWPSKLVISWNESVMLRNSHPVLWLLFFLCFSNPWDWYLYYIPIQTSESLELHCYTPREFLPSFTTGVG